MSLQDNGTLKKFKTETDVDIRLLMKEVAISKKNQKEASARANALAHENSKIQHEINLHVQRTNKAESKCSELAAKLSSEQVRANELDFINKQLQKELDEQRKDGTNAAQKIRQNLEELRRSHEENEGRRIKALNLLQKCKRVVGSSFSENAKSLKKLDFTQGVYKELRKAFDSMSSFLGDSVGDLSEKQDEGDIILNIRQMGESKETENDELKKQLFEGREELEKEREKTKEVLARYRESLEKVKQNSENLRERLGEMRDLTLEEKNKQEKKNKIRIQELVALTKELKSQLEKKEYEGTELNKKIYSLSNKKKAILVQNKELVQDIQEMEIIIHKLQKKLTKKEEELNSLKQLVTQKKRTHISRQSQEQYSEITSEGSNIQSSSAGKKLKKQQFNQYQDGNNYDDDDGEEEEEEEEDDSQISALEEYKSHSEQLQNEEDEEEEEEGEDESEGDQNYQEQGLTTLENVEQSNNGNSYYQKIKSSDENFYSFARRNHQQGASQTSSRRSSQTVESKGIENEIYLLDTEINQIKQSLAEELAASKK